METAKRTIAKARWTAKDAKLVLKAWEVSGLPMTRWATQVGVDRGRLMRWKKRVGWSGRRKDAGFHRVRVVGLAGVKESAPLMLEARLASGVEVRIPEGYCGSDLSAVVSALARRGS